MLVDAVEQCKEIADSVNVNLVLKLKISECFLDISTRRIFGLFSFPSLFPWAVDRFALVKLLTKDERLGVEFSLLDFDSTKLVVKT